MSQLYNTQAHFSTLLTHFFHSSFPNISKTQLNFLPSLILGIVLSESSVSSDIAASLKDRFSFVQISSASKRIYRFLHNPRFDVHSFYDSFIHCLIDHFSFKHKDQKVHIFLIILTFVIVLPF